MRKLVLGLLGFAAIGFGALPSSRPRPSPIIPAIATVRAVEYRDASPVDGSDEHRAYRPAFAPGPYRGGYREDYGRPHGYYRPVFAGPTLLVRMQRAWNGCRW